ncbi:MAG: phospho-N-acetylmuramoyl-pentapeptide-transferase [Paramuribaculum sp.]|nr:phospho-N-acetylmuramoyl-pentapeptide-transferase [Paramuribaculum sp.]
MLIPLFEWFDKLGISGTGVMQYVTFRALLAFIFALILATLVGNKIIDYLRHHQIGDMPRDIGVDGFDLKKGTPTMGGVIIFIAIVVPALLFCDLTNVYVWLMLATTVILTSLGFLDDYIKVFRKNKEGLSGKWKIVGQIAVGLILGLTLYLDSDVVIRENVETVQTEEITQINYSQHDIKSTQTTIPFVKNNNFDYKWLASALPDDWQQTAGWIIFIIVVIFIVTGTSNGSNLTDGLDGLTAGICAIIGLGLMILAYVSSHIEFASYLNIMYIPGAQEVFIYMAAFTGACMGFLWFNGYPARVFMGDTGSLMLGGLIATVAIILHKEIMLILFCGVFLVESISVMMQRGYYKYSRRRTGNPVRIFRRAPLHHHFQMEPGSVESLIKRPSHKWHEQTIVLRFWLITVLLCAFAIITLKIR